MTLDLNELVADWECPPGDVAARIVTGRDGADVVQMRVELGLMQMYPDGRPDAATRAAAAEEGVRVEPRRQAGGAIATQDWREFERQLLQLNYRRLAFGAIAEAALSRGDCPEAEVQLRRAVRDIAACRSMIETMRGHGVMGGGGPGLTIALQFQLARMTAQLLVLADRHDEAIDALEDGATELAGVLAGLGAPPEAIEQDGGLQFLKDLSRTLRKDFRIPMTLRERLAQAIERDDFELAAILRNELRERESRE